MISLPLTRDERVARGTAGDRRDAVAGVAAVIYLIPLVLAVTGCFASQMALAQAPRAPGVPGFLLGLWHGFIAPIGFIVSLFSDTIRLYAVPNVGRWYDFGFMLGIGGFSSGIFAGSKQRPRR